MTAKEKLLKIVANAKGDDLERAKRQYKGDEKLIAPYRKERAEWQEAYNLAKKTTDDKK